MHNWRFVKRTNVTMLRRVLNPIIFVLLALVFCGIFLVALGHNPFAVYGKMLQSIVSVKGLQKKYCVGSAAGFYRPRSSIWISHEPE